MYSYLLQYPDRALTLLAFSMLLLEVVAWHIRWESSLQPVINWGRWAGGIVGVLLTVHWYFMVAVKDAFPALYG